MAFILWATGYFVYCQNIPYNKPIGKFLADSITLGETVDYSIVFKHDAKQEVFFPEKNYNFSPFELVDKVYFPTKTSGQLSVDSAIYRLRTFNIASYQSLSLPIYLLKNADSITVYPLSDSVKRISETKGDLKNLTVMDKPELLPMKNKINVLMVMLQIVTMVLVALIWWLVFGKIVKAQFRLLGMYRRHTDFSNNFNKNTKTPNKANLEKALIVWKNYVGKLKKMEFNTMTSAEIVKNITNIGLSDALSEIDKTIYGNEISENITPAIQFLKKTADQIYINSKKENN